MRGNLVFCPFAHDSTGSHDSRLEREEHPISKIFIGNLSFDTTTEELATFLAPAGNVTEVIIPADRASGRPRGFAFASFASDEEAAQAIELADGAELGGRTLRANPAESRPPRPGFQSAGRGPGGDRGKPNRPKGSRRGLRSRKRSL